MENKVPQQMQIPPDDIPGQMGQNPIMTLSYAISSPDDVYTPNCQSSLTILIPSSLITDESQISDSPQQVSSSLPTPDRMSQPLSPMKGEPMHLRRSARERDPINRFIPGLPGPAGYLTARTSVLYPTSRNLN